MSTNHDFVAVPLVWFPDAALTGAEFLTLAALCHWVGTTTGSAWPSHRTLASYAHLSESTVLRSLARLVKRGILTCERRRTDSGHWLTNKYTVVGWAAIRPMPRKRGVTTPPLGESPTTSRGGIDDTSGVSGCDPNLSTSTTEKKTSSPSPSPEGGAVESGMQDDPAALAKAWIDRGFRPERVRYDPRVA